MDRLILILLALMAVGAVMSLLLSKFFKRKWIWYSPSMIGTLFIVYYLLKIQFVEMEGFGELGYLIIIFMLIAIVTGNILTNLFIVMKRNKVKKK